MLKIDADVKKTTKRHQCENCFSLTHTFFCINQEVPVLAEHRMRMRILFKETFSSFTSGVGEPNVAVPRGLMTLSSWVTHHRGPKV